MADAIYVPHVEYDVSKGKHKNLLTDVRVKLIGGNVVFLVGLRGAKQLVIRVDIIKGARRKGSLGPRRKEQAQARAS